MAASSGDAAALADNRRAEKIFLLFLFFFCSALNVGVPWWTSTRPPEPLASFSVMVTDDGSIDPLHGPVIYPVFDLYLRVDNYGMDFTMCREKATVTVSYGGMILGWGELQDWCVDPRASSAAAEVKAVMSHADVLLTDELRRRMASEMRAGKMEVSVEVRMLFPEGYECQHWAREVFLYCRVRPGQGYSPACYVHTLQVS